MALPTSTWAPTVAAKPTTTTTSTYSLPKAAPMTTQQAASTKLATPTTGLINQALAAPKPMATPTMTTAPASMGARSDFPTYSTPAPSNTISPAQTFTPPKQTAPAPVTQPTNTTQNPNYNIMTSGFNSAPQGTPVTTTQPQTQPQVQSQNTTPSTFAATQEPTMNNNTPNATYTQAGPTPQAGIIQQLLNLQGQVQPQIQGVAGQIGDLKTQLATQLGANSQNPIPLEFQTGRANVLQNMESQKEAALQGQLQNIISGYNMQAGSLESAAGLSAPLVMGLGQTAQAPTGGGANGGYIVSPQQAAQNATYAGQVQNNIQQSSNFANQAAPLATTMKQIDALTPQITSFMSSVGLNPNTIPFANEAIQAYLARTNPAAIASLNAMVGDFKTYASQILGESGLTPTAVTAITDSLDPSKMNGKDLAQFMQTITAIGNTRLAPLQGAATGAQSANTNGQLYTGAPAVNTALPTPQSVAGSDYGNDFAQTVGSFLLAKDWAAGLIEGIFHKIF